MPKVLFATPAYSYFTNPVTAALTRLGFQVSLFDYQKPTLISRAIGLLGNHGILSKTLSYQLIASQLHQSLLDRIKKIRPHYFLTIKGDTIAPHTVRAISQQNVITINWYSDWYDSWGWIKTHAPAYDYFVNMCRATHHRLKNISVNSYYLPVGSYLDDKSFKIHPKKYPITFVGQYTPRREAYFQTIADLGFTIWGYQGWQTSHLRHLAHGPVSVQETRDIIKASKITVNILNGSDTRQPDQINTRTVETTSVGSFLLVHDTPILHRYFRPGKEVVTFKTPQQLRQKAIYYLTHDQQRQRIAQAGYRRARRDHTFTNRLNELFALVKG